MQILEASPTTPVTPDLLRRAYTRLFLQSGNSEQGPLAAFGSITEDVDAPSSRLTKTRDYLRRLGVPLSSGQADDATSSGSFFLNGAHFPIDEVRFFLLSLELSVTTDASPRLIGLHTKPPTHSRTSLAVPSARDLPQFAYRRSRCEHVFCRFTLDLRTQEPLHLYFE